MSAQRNNAINNSHRFAMSNEIIPAAPETWVILRTRETMREWWTGSHWFDDLQQANQYDHESDAGVESQNEIAVAIKRSAVDD